MRVTTKQVVNIEMGNDDFHLLLYTLEEASKVRSKLYPLMNQRAARLRDSLTEGRGTIKLSSLTGEHEGVLDAKDE